MGWSPGLVQRNAPFSSGRSIDLVNFRASFRLVFQDGDVLVSQPTPPPLPPHVDATAYGHPGLVAHEVHSHLRTPVHHTGKLPRVLQADPMAGISQREYLQLGMCRT